MGDRTILFSKLSLQRDSTVEYFKEYGVKTPEGQVAFSADEAFEIAKKLPTPDCVVKAQVLAGGRGKGHFRRNGEAGLDGGVKLAFSPDEAKNLAGLLI